MATLSAIRSQVYSLLREVSGTDSNFSTGQIDSFINQAMKLLVPIIEQPRKFSSGTQVNQGDGDYSVPDDFVRLNTAYFGDESLQNDSKPLQFVTEETLRSMFPSWRSSHTSNQGRPAFIFMLDDDTFYIYPTPNAAESVTGKKLTYSYLFQPADLSSDSDVPDLPLSYHDILKFYVAHLCYLNLSNQDMAAKMLKEFGDHHKQIQLTSTVESKEALGWAWAHDDGVNDDVVGNSGDLVI